MADQYAVMGNPIAHSKSPQIHAMFAAQTQQSLEYKAQLVAEGGFTQAVEAFFSQGKGLNITVPFKHEAWDVAQNLSERARMAGAVNTLLLDDEGKIFGENTDGCGLVRDLTRNQGVSLKGKRILILGAGGAVRGILHPFLCEGPKSICIANRTLSRAEDLVADFAEFAPLCEGLSASTFAALDGSFDLIINGTSASLSGDLPPLADSLISAQTECYDMMYGAAPTVFNTWAKNLGAAKCIDGLGMLVEQAAESFRLWRGVEVDTAPVLRKLREAL